MFLCVSLNPAIDKRLRFEKLCLGAVNRALEVRPAPGGKAAHVAMVLRTLGAYPVWLGFAGGATGAALLEGLQQLSIRAISVATAAPTRTNLEMIDENSVTEILEPGEEITSAELRQLEATYTKLLSETNSHKTVILSGSLPAGVPADYYKSLIELAHRLGSRAFVDASGESFRSALSGKPDFVKPNREEAKSWSGRDIDGAASAETVLETILNSGAEAGAISLGSQGLVWRSASEKALFATVPQLTAQSSVGSGDSTLAGFAYAAQHGMTPVDSVRLAAACGSANCLADLPGLARAADIERLKSQIRVEVLH
jgi:1-phosphofructokinase family hexose kinase